MYLVEVSLPTDHIPVKTIPAPQQKTGVWFLGSMLSFQEVLILSGLRL